MCLGEPYGFRHCRGRGTYRTLCRLPVDIDYFAPGRGKTEFPTDKLLPDGFHFRSAFRTVSLFFGKGDDLIPRRHTLKDIRMGALCPAGMFSDNAFFRLFPCGGCLLLSLIEKAELSFHIFRLFTGCAEEFFRKIIDLFIQDRHCFIIRSNGLAQGIDKLILASDCHIQLADRVLILHDSGVLRVFCHLSLPPLLMLLLYHRKHLE